MERIFPPCILEWTHQCKAFNGSAVNLWHVPWVKTVRCIVLQSRWCESVSNNVWWAPFQWTQYVWCVCSLLVDPKMCGVSEPNNVAWPSLCASNNLWCDDRVHNPKNVAEPLSWQALKSLSPHCLIFGFHALMNCTLASQRHTGTLITVHWAYKGLRTKSDLK